MVLSTLVFAMMSTMVKYLSQFGTFQLVFFRSFITLVFTLGFLLVNKIPLLGHQRKLLFYRGISGATSMILFFSALHFMAIGTAVTLRYTAPLFVALLSVWVLKEKIKGIQWFFFLLAFGGYIAQLVVSVLSYLTTATPRSTARLAAAAAPARCLAQPAERIIR